MAVSAASARTVTTATPTASPTSTTPAPPPTSIPSPSRRGSAPDLTLPPPTLSQTPPPNPLPNEDLLVPTVFTWTFPTQSVFISGAWDDWTSKTPLYKNGPEYIALIYIPVGEYHCKFLVDDTWQCAPHIPTKTDERGNINNVVNIVADDPEFDSSAPLDAPSPPSPLSSYNQAGMREFSADPPVLPPHLERRLKPLPEDISPSVRENAGDGNGDAGNDGSSSVVEVANAGRSFASHVYIDHLYKEKGEEEDDVQFLSQVTRVGKKVVNTVFVTCQTSQRGSRPEGNGFAKFTPS